MATLDTTEIPPEDQVPTDLLIAFLSIADTNDPLVAVATQKLRESAESNLFRNLDDDQWRYVFKVTLEQLCESLEVESRERVDWARFESLNTRLDNLRIALSNTHETFQDLFEPSLKQAERLTRGARDSGYNNVAWCEITSFAKEVVQHVNLLLNR